MTEKRKGLSRGKDAGRRRGTWWVVGAILLAIIAGGVYLYWHKSAAHHQVDSARLMGQWLRSDGGYILELKEIGKDGTLKAAYFNPRPINVAKAALSRKDGWLTIFIELRDINYPGSKYNLQYDPGADRLRGTYFQAIQKLTFDVEFMRVKR